MAHAVVIGASIAGLCAAKALATRFDQVTIVERDTLPDQVAARKGLPQANHVHVLLASGQRAMGKLFPGIDDDLLRAGALPIDPGADMAIYRFGRVWGKISIGLTILSFSRPLLDHTLRRRLGEVSNVAIRSGVAVSGLAGSGDRVTGVVLDDGQTLAADLVVDASGRGSRSDRWLQELGFPAPETVEVKIGVGYATRFFKRENGFLPEGKGIYVLPTLPDKHAGLVLPIEDDRWLISVGGWHSEYPRDEEAMDAFAAALPYPRIHEMLKTCEPIGPLYTHSFPSSKRRYFEKLERVPRGYLATGDSVCSFNPIYGQGMTVAMLDALALLDTTEPKEFYRRVAENLKVPWRFAVGGDFAFPETTGPRPRGIKLLNRYSRRLQFVATDDPVVRRAFTSVQHLVAPPSELFKPRILTRVLRPLAGAPQRRDR